MDGKRDTGSHGVSRAERGAEGKRVSWRQTRGKNTGSLCAHVPREALGSVRRDVNRLPCLPVDRLQDVLVPKALAGEVDSGGAVWAAEVLLDDVTDLSYRLFTQREFLCGKE